MHNLVSESNVLDWINESAQECRSSYPMLQQKLPVAIDIGANVGGFCINAHPHFDKIYAFEPCSSNYDILLRVKEKLKMNNVEIFNMAVAGKSNETRTLKIHQNNHSKDISCADFDNEEFKFANLGETCTTISLSDLMASLQIKRINYLKLDCEGSEYEILENFHEHHRVSIIAMELHGFYGPDRKRDLLLFLNKFYYILPLVKKQKIQLENIKKHAMTNFKLLHGKNNFFCLNRGALAT
jgi:FkbM family methyltransferase|tara:strand:+ start:68 stop:787 length:720 start_codon:yes stop_codon:yes gene_type:complete